MAPGTPQNDQKRPRWQVAQDLTPDSEEDPFGLSYVLEELRPQRSVAEPSTRPRSPDPMAVAKGVGCHACWYREVPPWQCVCGVHLCYHCRWEAKEYCVPRRCVCGHQIDSE